MADETIIEDSVVAALSDVLDANHPEPDDDGFVWELVDYTCAHCGAVNQFHKQKPEWLEPVEPTWAGAPEPPSGVVWECSSCQGKNVLGGRAPVAPDLTVLECGACHSTFAPSRTDIDENSEWTCAVCSTRNRHVAGSESGTSEEVGKKASG